VAAFVIIRLLMIMWTRRIRLQPTNFSPTAASILLTPILAAMCFSVFLSLEMPQKILPNVMRCGVLFGPIVIVLVPFALYYFIQDYRQRPVIRASITVTIAILSVVLEASWSMYLLGP
jgi:hypothetical protein